MTKFTKTKYDLIARTYLHICYSPLFTYVLVAIGLGNLAHLVGPQHMDQDMVGGEFRFVHSCRLKLFGPMVPQIPSTSEAVRTVSPGV